jgi:hypothetical protein
MKQCSVTILMEESSFKARPNHLVEHDQDDDNDEDVRADLHSDRTQDLSSHEFFEFVALVFRLLIA